MSTLHVRPASRITCAENTIAPLLSKQTSDSPQNTVLLGVIGVIFTRDLKNGREGRSVGVDTVSYSIGNMLVDKHNANVLSLIGEPVEGSLNGSGVCFVVDNEKVLLRIGARGNVTDAREEQSCYGILITDDGEKLAILVIRLRSHGECSERR